jgi:hypothetical protein
LSWEAIGKIYLVMKFQNITRTISRGSTSAKDLGGVGGIIPAVGVERPVDKVLRVTEGTDVYDPSWNS